MVAITFSKRTHTRLESGSLPRTETKNDVRVDLGLLPSEEQYLHTLVLYDKDAPSSPFIHWIVANIEDNDINDGEDVFPYMPPQPPVGSGPHRYILEIFRQRYPLEFKYQDYDRKNFPLDEFIESNNLEAIDKTIVELESGMEDNIYPQDDRRFAGTRYFLGVNNAADVDDLYSGDPDAYATNRNYDGYHRHGHHHHYHRHRRHHGYYDDLLFFGRNYNDSDAGHEDSLDDRQSSGSHCPANRRYSGSTRRPSSPTRRSSSPTRRSSNPTRRSSSPSRRYSGSDNVSSSRVSPPPYKSSINIPPQEKKYCDCLMEVSGRKTKTGKGPYNKYAVCASSTGTTSRNCSKYYDFDRMSDDEIKDWLKAHKLLQTEKYDRKKALRVIKNKLSR
jgi:hypothetical protein